MPESPEVTFLAKEMHAKFTKRTLTSVKIVGGRYKKHGPPANFKHFTSQLPTQLAEVSKKGKVLFFKFKNGWTMVSRLGLTGWWYANDDAPSWKGSPHTSLIFEFGPRNRMVYDDQLSYGTITLCKHAEAEQIEAHIAPDVMDPKTTWKMIKDRLQHVKGTQLIEDVLVEQGRIISGIGNYLKSEILYGAKIAPMRKVGTMNDADWKAILRVAKHTSLRMYKAVLKDDDELYEQSMQIYKKKKDPHGNDVKTYMNKNGRTTYWVPSIQK